MGIGKEERGTEVNKYGRDVNGTNEAGKDEEGTAKDGVGIEKADTGEKDRAKIETGVEDIEETGVDQKKEVKHEVVKQKQSKIH